MPTPVPSAAINAAAPTSRSSFRLIAGAVDATNRDADTLRRALLEQWTDDAGSYQLEQQLRSLDERDPDGELGVDARLAIWFVAADPGDGRLVNDDHPMLDGLSAAFRDRLAGIIRPTSS